MTVFTCQKSCQPCYDKPLSALVMVSERKILGLEIPLVMWVYPLDGVLKRQFDKIFEILSRFYRITVKSKKEGIRKCIKLKFLKTESMHPFSVILDTTIGGIGIGTEKTAMIIDRKTLKSLNIIFCKERKELIGENTRFVEKIHELSGVLSSFIESIIEEIKNPGFFERPEELAEIKTNNFILKRQKTNAEIQYIHGNYQECYNILNKEMQKHKKTGQGGVLLGCEELFLHAKYLKSEQHSLPEKEKKKAEILLNEWKEIILKYNPKTEAKAFFSSIMRFCREKINIDAQGAIKELCILYERLGEDRKDVFEEEVSDFLIKNKMHKKAASMCLLDFLRKKKGSLLELYNAASHFKEFGFSDECKFRWPYFQLSLIQEMQKRYKEEECLFFPSAFKTILMFGISISQKQAFFYETTNPLLLENKFYGHKKRIVDFKYKPLNVSLKKSEMEKNSIKRKAINKDKDVFVYSPMEKTEKEEYIHSSNIPFLLYMKVENTQRISLQGILKNIYTEGDVDCFCYEKTIFLSELEEKVVLVTCWLSGPGFLKITGVNIVFFETPVCYEIEYNAAVLKDFPLLIFSSSNLKSGWFFSHEEYDEQLVLSFSKYALKDPAFFETSFSHKEIEASYIENGVDEIKTMAKLGFTAGIYKCHAKFSYGFKSESEIFFMEEKIIFDVFIKRNAEVIGVNVFEVNDESFILFFTIFNQTDHRLCINILQNNKVCSTGEVSPKEAGEFYFEEAKAMPFSTGADNFIASLSFKWALNDLYGAVFFDEEQKENLREKLEYLLPKYCSVVLNVDKNETNESKGYISLSVKSFIKEAQKMKVRINISPYEGVYSFAPSFFVLSHSKNFVFLLEETYSHKMQFYFLEKVPVFIDVIISNINVEDVLFFKKRIFIS
eukprot:GHVN01101045.1.p1 GENE.GHVN01101045.1~~GHVN01101045.1.p1  ORF type:complete len:894 (+),score=79.65 GHVN01101045.1:2118-4799(+)